MSFLSLGRSQGVGPKQGSGPLRTQLRPAQILTAAYLSLLEADAHPLRATRPLPLCPGAHPHGPTWHPYPPLSRPGEATHAPLPQALMMLGGGGVTRWAPWVALKVGVKEVRSVQKGTRRC